MIARFASLRPARLRVWLGLLFIGLTVPTAALVLQAYRQLEFETFFLYQEQAASLAARIDEKLAADVAALSSRAVNDFRYYRGETPGTAPPSPLAEFPPPGGIAGLLGYFEVGPGGEFSTPVLPGNELSPALTGLAPEDYAVRALRAAEMLGVLQTGEFVGARQSTVATAPPADLEETTSLPPVMEPAEAGRAEPSAAQATYADQAASARNAVEDTAADSAPAPDDLRAMEGSLQPPSRSTASLGKLRDLRLDDALQQKSAERLDRQQLSADFDELEPDLAAPAAAFEERETGGSVDALGSEARVRAFAGDREPFRFGRLAGGHGVLFRNVWIDGERHVQGALLNLDTFVAVEIASKFDRSPLAGMSDLVVGLGDDVVNITRAISTGDGNRYSTVARELDGSLLYSARLSSPYDGFSLVFSVTDLPPGPAAAILGWSAAIFVLVLTGGLLGLYRVGVSQFRLAEQQQDFVTAVSHELKTPLTSIRMYGEMLRSGWVDESKREDYYAYIQEESERLTRLIDNVLQLSRITRNGPSFELRPVSVAELNDLLASKLREHVQRAGFELQQSTSEGLAPVRVRLDTDCFLQIAINLVDNAIKFSRDRDRKTIVCRFDNGDDESVIFSVRDFGPGIHKSQLRRIFELFYRPSSETTRETAGTGIGLAIVSTLARGMGGDVEAVNRQPGAEFRVSLPLAEDST